MNEPAFALYCAAAAVDLCAVAVAVHDTVVRYHRTTAFALPVSPSRVLTVRGGLLSQD